MDKQELIDLLAAARESMWNLAPRIRSEHGGCFGRAVGGMDRPCVCTACRITRAIDELRQEDEL